MTGICRFLVAALDTFVSVGDGGVGSGGRLPLGGGVPDMTSSTELFVQLQQLYSQQAEADLQRFCAILQTLIAVRYIYLFIFVYLFVAL